MRRIASIAFYGIGFLALMWTLLLILSGPFGVAVGETDPDRLTRSIVWSLGIAVVLLIAGWVVSSKPPSKEIEPLNLKNSILRALCILGALFFGINSNSIFLYFILDRSAPNSPPTSSILLFWGFGNLALTFGSVVLYRKIGHKR